MAGFSIALWGGLFFLGLFLELFGLGLQICCGLFLQSFGLFGELAEIFFVGLAHAIHESHNDEDTESDDDEVDDVLDEHTVVDAGIFYRDAETGEVDTAENETDERGDDVIHEGIDNGGEGAAYDHTYCEIDDGATVDKFFEFGNEAFFLFFCHNNFIITQKRYLGYFSKSIILRQKFYSEAKEGRRVVREL